DLDQVWVATTRVTFGPDGVSTPRVCGSRSSVVRLSHLTGCSSVHDWPASITASKAWGILMLSGDRALPGGSCPLSYSASVSRMRRRVWATATSLDDRFSFVRSTIGPMLV